MKELWPQKSQNGEFYRKSISSVFTGVFTYC